MVPLSRVPVLSQFIGYLIFLLIISELESKHIEVKFNCRSWFCNFQTGFWIVYILSLSFLFFHLELHGIAETNNILIFMWPVEICFYIDESARLPPGFRRYSSPFSGKLLILFTSLAPSMHLFCVLTFVLWFLQRREVYGAWEQYLGMEHTDTAPKRAYTVNQVCSFLMKWCCQIFWCLSVAVHHCLGIKMPCFVVLITASLWELKFLVNMIYHLSICPECAEHVVDHNRNHLSNYSMCIQVTSFLLLHFHAVWLANK